MSLLSFTVSKPTLLDFLQNDVRILERSLEVQFTDRRNSIHKTDVDFQASRNATLERLANKRAELLAFVGQGA